MIPGAEMRARLDDRIGVAAVTYLLFGVTLGPGLVLSLVLVFAVWIGWRWLCRTTGLPLGPVTRMPLLTNGQEFSFLVFVELQEQLEDMLHRAADVSRPVRPHALMSSPGRLLGQRLD